MKLIITPHLGYPKGIKCELCKRVSQPGQPVLWKGVKNVGHTIYHAACMTELLDSTPKLLHKDEVDAKLQQIASEYAEGNYFNG